ncbi:hypothetical protein FV228_15825 [Methylobacterium sp. WL18]|uniref:hypothetical protein n=1 Tax=Methylobacterium sp. WL18 TaxID=2603897 RepID=UPI0011C8A066|nr:hypothetical protein [Methylobacterium sp. WL18]TXN65375.1 hypothetical protein FV228_15825 [Methylobacterium sp. WL18]
MSRFTKAQMRDELREILLYQADHLVCCGTTDAAEAFIGFPPENDEGVYESYWRLDASEVDLARFRISESFDLAYDFTFEPSLIHHIHPVELGSLVAFMNGIPRPMSQDIDNIDPLLPMRPLSASFMEQDGYCQTVADAAVARWKLEVSGQGTFTPRELALLANMSEGAVRNAMSDKSESALKPIPGSKPIQVEHEDALRWLRNRRGYKAIPRRVGDDDTAKSKLEAVRTSSELAQIIDQHFHTFIAGHPFQDISRSNFTSADKAHFQINQMPKGIKSLDWSLEELKSWRDGSFRFDQEKALKLAEALGLNVPLFAGKALEVSLRRDMGAEDRR